MNENKTPSEEVQALEKQYMSMSLVGTCPDTGTSNVMKKSGLTDTENMQFVCSECGLLLGEESNAVLRFREHTK